MSLRPLARFVNDLLDSGQASVTEVAAGPVVLHGVDQIAASTLIALISDASWSCDLVDSADAEVLVGDLSQYLAPFHITIHKVVASGETLFVSTKAFSQWIEDQDAVGVVRVLDATSGFETESFSVVAYEDSNPGYRQADVRKSPLETVKCIGVCRYLPRDIRPYILRDGGDLPWGDVAFEAWTRIAMKKLMCSLASEVHAATNKVEFSGPPRMVLTTVEEASVVALGGNGFLALQAAAKWIYELEREAETRHRLFSIEFARSISGVSEVSLAFKEATAVSLEGARIAHGFGLLDLSKDALKSMGDLRKAVADETSKLTEAMRQLSLSVAGALFYGLALVAAKLSSVVNVFLLDVMALVGAAYVGIIVMVNRKYLSQQKLLRASWRERFYRFLRTDDYDAMVENPIKSSESSLELAMWIALGMTLASFLAVVVNNHLS